MPTLRASVDDGTQLVQEAVHGAPVAQIAAFFQQDGPDGARGLVDKARLGQQRQDLLLLLWGELAGDFAWGLDLHFNRQRGLRAARRRHECAGLDPLLQGVWGELEGWV